MFFIVFAACFFTQPARGDAKSTFDINQELDQLDQQVRRARILLPTQQAPNALTSLRAAAETSWKVLFAASGNTNYATSTKAIPANGITGRAARKAAEAHYWWGVAARQFHANDEAITAFARAARLFPAKKDSTDLLHANINTALTQSLQNGLPQSAAPDVLLNIATFAEQNHWQLKSTFWQNASIKSTFLYTDGDLNAPSQLPKVAPLYRNIPETQLPEELRSPKILYIYSKSANDDSGLATLQVKVRYNAAKDAPLAARLAQIMLKARLLNDHFLHRSHPVITLWLETVAANWPSAPDENSPWEAAAKIDSAPNDIMVFRITQPRTDGEWTRELLHEYGHVAWPNFKTFVAPLEPNANGLVSETMGTLWLAQNPSDNKDIQSFLSEHIQKNALGALHAWLNAGPTSALATGQDELSLHYLQGLCVYIDRVYGTSIFSSVIQKRYIANNNAQNILEEFSSLITTNKTHSLYLPAAAILPTIDISPFIHRTPVTYASDATVDFRIYIPPQTTRLIIPWQGDGGITSKSTFGTGTSYPQKYIVNLNGISGWQTLRLHIDGDVRLDFIQCE